MGHLTEDCFACGGAALSVEEAAALILERVAPLPGEEMLPLARARGRVLAAALHAPHPLPPFANSAVDGYAIRHADLAAAGETRLCLAGRVAAGQVAGGALAPGMACRIFTGAPLPPGADTVMMQEDARLEGEALHLPPGLEWGANCRAAGEDVAQGALALPAGRLLDAAAIGLAAALGQPALAVRRRPRIGVFSTGDELAAPGTPLGPARTYDSNRFSLLALLGGLPVEAVDLGILPDRAAETRAALCEAAAAHDMLLTSGGVSTGEEDHVRAALEAAGSLVFWRLALKPGRPAALGVIGGTPVLGLPGNPVACFVTFLHLARPLALRLSGASAPPLPRFVAEAAFAHRKKPGRREYLRVRLVPGPGGMPLAHQHPGAGSASLASLAESDAFAELPEASTGVAPGERLVVLPFTGVF
ncbi:molybdopterin molybdotransferase MoeA [Roseomonas sp. GC11]|uniref:molybdopterin molybdotransferase MoeA n=1 Tax=Roseomonas sp. GC11 TaxID=2950546 RepID=UPI0021096671|nr:gephyrin-like molybdotransferase Glp [Roseomonas sp. GC11]MCQ4158856.1 molybdopterin molybdotransferase MoeA [Roseomonas sp. GC11]